MRKFVLGALASFAMAAPAWAQSQFYLFPVGVLEGVSTDEKLVNPALQRSLVRALTAEPARPDVAIINRFREALRHTFPQSTVHPSQVGDSGSGGNVVYQQADACGSGFTVPISSAYAAVLAVSRATIYRVERGGNVDYLIPVTLTLQIIKPDKGKVAYTLSDTLYSPFVFTKQEDANPATRALIDRKVIENMMTQVDHLVSEAGKAFNPKSTEVTVIGRSGKYLVVDGGYEIGFNKDDEPSAVRPEQPDRELFFKVVSAASGHSVLRVRQDDVPVGTKLRFEFTSAADDSDKPGLMPVTAFSEYGEQFDRQAALAQQFVRSIGFSSRFNVVPVSTNFKNAMRLITGQANCVSSDKLRGASEVKGGRPGSPHFFAQFEAHVSESYVNEGSRNAQGVSTESEEDFAVAASVRLVDSSMRVHYSETVVEPYKIQRVNNKGLDSGSARDVALRNAVTKLSASFARNAKLEIRDVQISKVEGNRIWIPGAGIRAEDVGARTVYRELPVAFRGQKVLVPLELGEGNEPRVAQDGPDLVLSFSRIDDDVPMPAKGDRVRLEGLAKPGAAAVLRCPIDDYLSDRSAYAPKFTNMFVEAAINASPKLQLVETGDSFFKLTERMLDVGNFRTDVLKKAAAPALCYQAGAAVRPDAVKCEAGRCRATVVSGLIARFGPVGGAPTQQVQAAQQTEVSNFAEARAREFLGYQSMLWFDGLQGELKKKTQIFAPK